MRASGSGALVLAQPAQGRSVAARATAASAAVKASPKLLGIVIKPSAAIALVPHKQMPKIVAASLPTSDGRIRNRMDGSTLPRTTARAGATIRGSASSGGGRISATSCRGLLPHVIGQRLRLVVALQELDGHEDHLLV